MYKIIQDNDIAIDWQIRFKNANIDFTNAAVTVYICDSIGKRIVTSLTKDANGLHFIFKGADQFSGVVRLEAVWTTVSSGNRRVVADKVIDYINDPENVDGDIDTVNIVTTAYKSAITYT